MANELLTRDTDDNASVNYTFAYDAVGNMTDDGQRYTYKYDAFGRLKEVRNRSSTALVAEYRYNGLGYRIGWHYDADADGTVESSTDDPWYQFVYDERWRILNTYRLADWDYNVSNPAAANAKERFVYHKAGLGGFGDSSYIDAVILRDRDGDTAWNAASDGTMEERVFYAQNWRHDVSALLTDDGRMLEWAKYSSYGVPWSLPAGDTDSDGDFDSADDAVISGGGAYDVRKDVNLDGSVDVTDFLDAIDLNNGYSTLGWSKLGATRWGNRKGYAGYEGDIALAGTKWHVRHRVLESDLGRWMRRDPLGELVGLNIFEYCNSRPVAQSDPSGLLPPAMKCWSDDRTSSDFDGVCEIYCKAARGVGGLTYCMKNGENKCCICDTTIKQIYPTNTGPIKECILAHEQEHGSLPCPRPVNWSGSSEHGCSEVAAYAVELSCLASKRAQCATDQCKSDIDRRMDQVTEQINQYWNMCLHGPPAGPRPGGGGVYRPTSL